MMPGSRIILSAKSIEDMGERPRTVLAGESPDKAAHVHPAHSFRSVDQRK